MLIDLHAHTRPHSWDSELTPDELIERAKARGLDGVVLTEHDTAFDPEEARALGRRHRFLVLAGIEMNVEEGHALVYGLHSYDVAMHRLRHLAASVRAAGGAMIAAHPYRRWMPQPVVLQTMEWDDRREYARALRRAEGVGLFREDRVCAMDVLNGRGSLAENGFSHELAERLGMARSGASDSHRPEDVGRAATYFDRPVSTEEELVEELLAGRVWALDLTRGELTEDPQYHDVPTDLAGRWRRIAARRRDWARSQAAAGGG